MINIAEHAEQLQYMRDTLKEVEAALIDETITFGVVVGHYNFRLGKGETRQRMLELSRDRIINRINKFKSEMEQELKNM